MPPFAGSITALVTPFKDGAVDEAGFRKFINWQIENGTHGVVPVGTTGESPTLSHKEHERVVEITVDEVKGRVPVIAGAGSNSTAEAIGFSQHAERVGADAVLDRHALLQQADPGRHVRPFQGHQRCDRHPDHHLQHPRPLGDRHVGGHDGPALSSSRTSWA